LQGMLEVKNMNCDLDLINNLNGREANVIGSPVVSQCAVAFAVAIPERGIGDVANASRVPSSQSS